MPESMISEVLRFIWVPIVTAMAILWSRIFGVSARTGLLEQQSEQFKLQRVEDQKRHSKDRDEMKEMIDTHHTLIMEKLDQVDTRIKNGH